MGVGAGVVTVRDLGMSNKEEERGRGGARRIDVQRKSDRLRVLRARGKED